MRDEISGRKQHCHDRCEFVSSNCYMNEDGTWDCSMDMENCEERCLSRGK